LTVHRLARLSLISILISLLLSAPIWVMLGQIFVDTRSIWQHLWQTVLLDYVTNSLLLMFGVGVGVLLLGVSTAWLTSCCEFPFRRSLTLLLLLPMAMPAYIIAYTYTGLLDFAGPVQSWIRAVTGLAYGQYWFPPIRSLTGAMLMLALVLYPYVYLLARAAFLAQSSTLLDVSRTLGLSAWQSFYRVTLPMARPAIIAGLSLALMETLADYGTVQFFGVTTFTTGIFRTFYGFGDAAAAAQLSLLLLSFVVVLVALEKYSRRRIGYYAAANYRPIQRRMPIQGWRALLVIGICFGPALLGFILPAALLLTWSLSSAQWFDTAFLTLIWHSFSLAAGAALISVSLAFVLAYAARLEKNRATQWAVQVTALGYAMPGTIIAIGVIISLSGLDHYLVPHLEALFAVDLGLLFSGSLFALLFAYTIRFLAVSLGSVQSGLLAIKPSLDASARLLGRTPLQVLTSIHVPLLRGSALTALLIVFVDVLKELPGTLILRPFNFNTLAVRAYELASDERLIDAAPASLMIVLVGLLPVYFLNRSINRS